MYYAFIDNGKINGCGQCECVSMQSVEITEEIFNNIDRYMWNGSEVVLDPNYEEKQAQKERERLNMLSLTKREVFLALYRAKGITPEQLKAQITNPEALIEFEYAESYYRGNPLIDLIGQSLGFTTEQLDYLFEFKSLPDGGITPVSDEKGNIPPEPAEGEN